MTDRQEIIVKQVLKFLEKLDEGQATEPVIHAHVSAAMGFGGEVYPSLAEIIQAVKLCDERHFINGVAARFNNKMKWNITDIGRAALLEMQ